MAVCLNLEAISFLYFIAQDVSNCCSKTLFFIFLLFQVYVRLRAFSMLHITGVHTILGFSFSPDGTGAAS